MTLYEITHKDVDAQEVSMLQACEEANDAVRDRLIDLLIASPPLKEDTSEVESFTMECRGYAKKT